MLKEGIRIKRMKQTQADKVQEITEQLEQGIKDLFESREVC